MMMPPGVLLRRPNREPEQLRTLSRTEYGENHCGWMLCELNRANGTPRHKTYDPVNVPSFLEISARRRSATEGVTRAEHDPDWCSSCGQVAKVASSGVVLPLRKSTYRRP